MSLPNLTATVQLINRTAELSGINPRINRPSKSLIKLRSLPDGRIQILVHTLRDPLQQRFYVNEINQLRARFLTQGMLTIELNNPPVNIMIKEAPQDQLEVFLGELRKLVKDSKEKGSKDSSRSSHSAATTTATSHLALATHSNSSRSNEKSSLKTGSNIPTPAPVIAPLFQQRLLSKLRNTTPPTTTPTATLSSQKRTRSSSPPGKSELTQIRKQLKLSTLSVSITSKTEYIDFLRKTTPQNLQCLTLNDVRLKGINEKILGLVNLSVLDICGCGLGSIDQLKTLQSPHLSILKASKNNIKWIDTEVFDGFKDLKVLDLSFNKLQILPTSITHLTKVYTLNVSNNDLTSLPYNFQLMSSLMELRCAQNNLRFLPLPLSTMHLRKVDVSGNPRKTESNPKGLMEPLREYHGFGSSNRIPSLLELTGEFILNMKMSTKPPTMPPYDLTMPRELRRYMDQSKRCILCNKMSLRYDYKVGKISKTGLWEELISDHLPDGCLCFKGALCFYCSTF